MVTVIKTIKNYKTKRNIYKKTITMIAVALLLGTQSLKGTPPFMGMPSSGVRALTVAEFPTPPYWDLLTSEKQVEYRAMQAMFRGEYFKYNRNKGLFLEQLNIIRAFTQNDQINGRLLELVCGISWYDDQHIAKCTQSLRTLTGKCRSSIDASFQELGCESERNHFAFVEHFPHIAKLPSNRRRQWGGLYLRISGDQSASKEVLPSIQELLNKDQPAQRKVFPSIQELLRGEPHQ
jgi:hypothetical protein